MDKLLIGLGNPGDEYRKTRHNVGHILIDLLGEIEGFTLIKNDLYMNQSGKSLRDYLQRHAYDPENIVVMHDDYVFEVGDYRVQFDKSANRHNGVQSIIDALGTQAFWRVRIGVGPYPDGISASDFVLSDFKPSQLEEIEFLAHELKREIPLQVSN